MVISGIGFYTIFLVGLVVTVAAVPVYDRFTN